MPDDFVRTEDLQAMHLAFGRQVKEILGPDVAAVFASGLPIRFRAELDSLLVRTEHCLLYAEDPAQLLWDWDELGRKLSAAGYSGGLDA